jgi:hypothetical protein
MVPLAMSKMTQVSGTNETDLIIFRESSERLFMHWLDYRLGDILKPAKKPINPAKAERQQRLHGNAVSTSRDAFTAAFVCTNWPSSLGCGYAAATDDQATNATRNYDHNHTAKANLGILDSLLEARMLALSVPLASNEAPRVTLHARTGDVMTGNDCWRVQCSQISCPRCHVQHNRSYVFPKAYYTSILGKIPSGSTIVVVSNPYHFVNAEERSRHGQVTISRSKIYLEQLVAYLSERGFCPIYHGDDKTPDEDFVMMATSDIFIAGGGGFSAFAADIVKRRGGLAVEPSRFWVTRSVNS